MKRKLVVVYVVLALVGVNVFLEAQTTHSKHHKKKPKVNADSLAAARADSTAKANAAAQIAAQAAAAAQVPVDTGVGTLNLVADTTTPPYTLMPLDSSKPQDGMYHIPMLRGAKPFALPKENAYDIKFYKRLWRTIDLKDSVNKIFAMHDETLIALIIGAIKGGKLIAYTDESFTHAMTYNQVMKTLSDSSAVNIIDSTNGDIIGSKMVFNPFNPDSITKYEIKEDVYFDKVRGRLITQIVSLAPMKHLITSNGVDLGAKHLFYLYFPQCRTPFAGKDIYDTERDIYNISFDDLFIQRNFRTVIVKESNPQDLSIADMYPNDSTKQVQEAERIERDLRNYKKNVWKY